MLSCLFFSLIIRIINGKVLRNININGGTWMNVYWMNEWKLYLSSEKSKSAYIKKWKKCKPYIKTNQIRANFFLFFLSPNLLFFSYFSKKFSANFRSDRSTYVRNIFFHSFYTFGVVNQFLDLKPLPLHFLEQNIFSLQLVENIEGYRSGWKL